MDPFVTLKRESLAKVLRHICQSEAVNAVRAEVHAGEAEPGERHRRNSEAARELEDRIERGTIADVSVEGALDSLMADVIAASA